MTCNPIKILEDGCLDKKVIELGCKGPEEELYYQFSMANRIGNQTLVDVQARSNSDNIVISDISVDGQTFKCLISGGEIYRNYPIHFVVKTSDGEKRTFNAILPIRPEGVMKAPEQQLTVVMGPSGADGKAASIQIGNVSKGDVASISNRGTDSAALFDFVLPKGDKGDKGDSGKDGTSPRLSIGTITTLAPDQQATASISDDGTGNKSINLGLVKGEKGDTGKQGVSYVNDGTVDLKVKSITSDGSKITTDGNGNVTIVSGDETGDYSKISVNDTEVATSGNLFKVSSKQFDINETQLLYGDKVFDRMNNKSFIDIGVFRQLCLRLFGEYSKYADYTANPYQGIDVFVEPNSTQANDGQYGMALQINGYINGGSSAIKIATLASDAVFGHDSLSFDASTTLTPVDPYWYASRTMRMVPQKLSNVKFANLKSLSAKATHNFMAGTIALVTNYYSRSDDDDKQDGFITQVIWDENSDDVTACRPMDLTIPSEKKDSVSTTYLKVGTRSFDATTKVPCWWNGSGWVDATGQTLT